jgi:hypothetical protein
VSRARGRDSGACLLGVQQLSVQTAQGSNDLAGVGCCRATVGYDPASGLGVPNWATLPTTLPNQADSLVGCSWWWPNGELAAADLVT